MASPSIRRGMASQRGETCPILPNIRESHSAQRPGWPVAMEAAMCNGDADETQVRDQEPLRSQDLGYLVQPQSIGRYRVIRRLGQGGFGRVYLGHDDGLDRPVAIKVPNPERIAHPSDVEAYLNEARILAKLDHPNIVPVHDVGRTEDGRCFVVSKLVEGSDLAVKIAG